MLSDNIKRGEYDRLVLGINTHPLTRKFTNQKAYEMYTSKPPKEGSQAEEVYQSEREKERE